MLEIPPKSPLSAFIPKTDLLPLGKTIIRYLRVDICFFVYFFLSGQIHIKFDRNLFVKFLSFLPEIEFKEGDTEHFVEVEILYDSVREMREAFTVHLKPDENMVAETKVQIKPSYHII